MPIALLDNLKEELRGLDSTITATLEKASTEERDLTEAESEILTSAKERTAVITPQMELVQSTQESRGAAADLAARIGSSNTITNDRPLAGGSQFAGRSMGDLFVASDAFNEYRGGGRSEAFEVKEDRSVLTTTSTPIGADFIPEPTKLMLANPAPEYPLLSAIRTTPVSTNSIEVVTYGSREGAATPAKVAEGAVKPEVTLTAAKQTLTLDTFAGWVSVTRQLLQDAGAIRSFIDTELRRGLATVREKEVAGAISGASLAVVTGAASQKTWEVIRTAIANVQMAGYNPNAVLMNPTDAAELDLAMIKAAGGWSSAPIAGLSPWGLKVITSPNVASGKVYVGDMQAGVTLYKRTETEIFITDSHGELFLSNTFVILGEQRFVADVTRPAALVEVKLTA